MKLETFRRRFPARAVKAGGQTWRVIETKARKGAPVLVMLPGTLGTAEIFWNQIAALGKKVRIVSVTYPPVDKLLDLAKGLAALFDKLGIEKASIVGSSMGGFLGQWFAARYPERVETLFIGNSLTDPYKVNPARKSPAALRRAPPEAHRAIVLGSVESWAEPEPIFATLKDILRHSGQKLISGEALKRRVLATATGKEVPPPVLPQNRTVIIECADDPLIPRPAQKAMREKYPRAKRYRLPRGGHYPYITRPADYTAILAKHLPTG
ncbi:MAG: alpha/beta hydrolase [Rhodospirillaceae bacterium]|nr:alpha/beta hydrolase [Rhodospirillaceae bacterium]